MLWQKPYEDRGPEMYLQIFSQFGGVGGVGGQNTSGFWGASTPDVHQEHRPLRPHTAAVDLSSYTSILFICLRILVYLVTYDSG